MNCPICTAPAGFHLPACYEYSRVPAALTRPPGADSFSLWLGNARSQTDEIGKLMTNDVNNDKFLLSIEQIMEDLVLGGEGSSSCDYRLPENTNASSGRRAIIADEYDDSGEIIATHKIWIEIEYDETGTQPSGHQK
jgi:hypothetical protein